MSPTRTKKKKEEEEEEEKRERKREKERGVVKEELKKIFIQFSLCQDFD